MKAARWPSVTESAAVDSTARAAILASWSVPPSRCWIRSRNEPALKCWPGAPSRENRSPTPAGNCAANLVSSPHRSRRARTLSTATTAASASSIETIPPRSRTSSMNSSDCIMVLSAGTAVTGCLKGAVGAWHSAGSTQGAFLRSASGDLFEAELRITQRQLVDEGDLLAIADGIDDRGHHSPGGQLGIGG